MATLDTVAKIVSSLPETAETASATGLRWWVVKKKTIAWERPLRKSDLAALGEGAPKGTMLGVWLPDMMTKASLLSANADVFFTTPHFDGHPSVLVTLARVDAKTLRALLVDAWLGRAPKRLAADFRTKRDGKAAAAADTKPKRARGTAARSARGSRRSR
jgi:hypothetical protein